MKIGIITQPNQKGQIVIPQKFRRALGIDEKVPLNITLRGQTICIDPITDIIAPIEEENYYSKILEKTKGSWADDDWPQGEKERRVVEQKAATKRREAW